MSVTHKDLREWLEKNEKHASEEIEYRILAGRYYYCVLHRAYEAFDKIIPTDFSNKRTGMHKQICSSLQKDKNKKIRVIGAKLDALRNRRGEADYEYHKHYPKSNLTRAKSESVTIISMISTAEKELNSE